MPPLASLKSHLLRTATNLRGWRTRRKLVVFESDDWGAIRMPSRQAYANLLDAGICVDKSPYNRLDCLENRQDLEALFDVLHRHQDKNGRSAIFTFNTVIGNPDFEAIKEDEFSVFYHQHFLDSYKYYHGDDLWPLWQQGMADKLIQPQFHAREHLNSTLWMQDLRAGKTETIIAFDNQFYGLNTQTGSPHQNKYLTAYWPTSKNNLEEIISIMLDGLKMFERTFGFRSKTFVACNYTWPEGIEKPLAQHGVGLIQTKRGRLEPKINNDFSASVRRHFSGQINAENQLYSVRNVSFESYIQSQDTMVDKALSEIKQAFFFGKPAVICSHRINYVGGMDLVHRDRNLKNLNKLLDEARKKWPDIEFLTSDELADVMISSDGDRSAF